MERRADRSAVARDRVRAAALPHRPGRGPAERGPLRAGGGPVCAGARRRRARGGLRRRGADLRGCRRPPRGGFAGSLAGARAARRGSRRRAGPTRLCAGRSLEPARLAARSTARRLGESAGRSGRRRPVDRAMNSLPELLLRGDDSAGAIGSTDDVPPLAYRELRAQMERTVARLNSFGLGRGDRIAIVLRNGPEMAASFACIAAGAATAPLNPGYRAEELEFSLADLEAKALVVEPGPSLARDVAGKLGIPILELHAQREAGAGTFTLESSLRGKPSVPGLAAADDVALLLHTSGTTSSRPKLVPLLQRNLVASARHIVESLQLVPGDLCLNFMPLFHIHGLMAATLASLAAGAHVCCSPGFSALRYFSWLEDVRPTWTTAVPNMHQAILDRAGRHRDQVGQNRLRFIRSSSASLPAPVMMELEEIFEAPVIESYGMTEAAHQMASNPLPPLRRKPGSVGVPAGPQIA